MSAARALVDLLLALFSADELRNYLRHEPDGEAISHALPGDTASASASAHLAVGVLERRGLVDAAFFDRLLAERPQRSADIERVRALFIPVSPPSAQPIQARANNSPLVRAPLARSRWFVGRTEVLAQIRDRLVALRDRPALALTGLGGVGKSLLALEYLYRHTIDEPNYAIALLVQADSKLTLQRELATLAGPLRLDVGSDEEARCHAVRRHLSEHGNWLLVLDDVASPDALAWIVPLLPEHFRGHVIVTSRFPHWDEFADEFPVTLLGRAESINLLYRRAGRLTQHEPEATADELARALGDLPLAIMQAAAYIKTAGKTFAEYLELFRHEQARLLERSRPADYPETVATTWSLAMDRARGERPEAADLLSLCAYLAPFPLVAALLRKGASRLPPSLVRLGASEIDWDDSVRTLVELSLVTAESGTLWVHQLVQAVTRLRLSADERRVWNDAALRWATALYQFDDSDAGTWLQANLILPHLLEAIRRGVEQDPRLAALPEAVHKALADLWNLADLRPARELLAHAAMCDIAPNSIAALSIESTRARVLLREGHVQTAYTALEKLLPRISALPDDNREVAESIVYNDLSCCASALGDYKAARAHALASLQALKGEPKRNPRYLAGSLATLAAAHLGLSEFAAARDVLKKVLAVYDEEVPPPHPRYAVVLNNLGEVLLQLGSLQESRDFLLQAFAMSEALFGPWHPQCAAILRNLYKVELRLGRRVEALQAAKSALKIDEVVLPAGHPNLAGDHSCVGQLHLEEGLFDEAKLHLERALAFYTQAFGDTNVHTATCRAQYGRVLEAKGDLLEARVQLERALVDLESSGHADTVHAAMVLINLGHVYSELNELKLAIESTRRGLAIDEVLYGPDNPEITADLHNFGALLARTSRPADGEPYLRRCLDIRRRHLPPAAPEIQWTRISLAACLARQKRHADAVVILNDGLAILPTEPKHAAGETLLVELFAHRAVSLAALGKLKKADIDLLAALDILKKQGRTESPECERLTQIRADLRRQRRTRLAPHR